MADRQPLNQGHDDLLDSGALSCRDVERLFGVPAKDVRAVLKQRMAHGDAESV